MSTALPFEIAGQEDNGMEVLPAGSYRAMVAAVEVKQTKNRDGTYAQIEFQVTDGKNDGRKVWGRYTLQNKNQQAAKIGERQLGDLAYACGVQVLTDLAQLLNKSCTIELVVRDDPQYGKQNDVKKARPLHAGGAEASAPATTSQQAAPSAPWEQ